jgi:hypothetical protein
MEAVYRITHHSDSRELTGSVHEKEKNEEVTPSVFFIL